MRLRTRPLAAEYPRSLFNSILLLLSRSILPVALAAALSVAVGALLVGLAPDRQPHWVRLLPFAAMLTVSGMALAAEHATRGLHLFSPLLIALTAYNLMFAVVPMTDLRFDIVPTQGAHWWLATWLVAGGLVFLLIGYHLAFRMRSPAAAVTWSPRRAKHLALLGVGLAAIAAMYSVGGPAGAATLIADFGQQRLKVEGSTVISIALSLAAPSVAILAASWTRDPRILWLLVAVTAVAVVSTGYSGQRWRVAGILVALLAIIHVGYRTIPRMVVIPALTALLAAMIWIGQHRNNPGTNLAAPSLEGQDFYYNYVGSTHEIGQFRDFATLLAGMPQKLDFQYGQTFLSVIPQAPFPTGGEQFTKTFFPGVPEIVSYPPSFPGELYMNFGVFGVVGGMLVFGFIVGALEGYWRRNRESVGALAVYGFATLPLALVLRGDFTSFGGFFLVGLGWLLVTVWLTARAKYAWT